MPPKGYKYKRCANCGCAEYVHNENFGCHSKKCKSDSYRYTRCKEFQPPTGGEGKS